MNSQNQHALFCGPVFQPAPRRSLSSRFPYVPGLDYHALHRASAGAGMDFFDLAAPPSGGLTVCVGNVSGHGTGSSILAAGLQAVLQDLTDHGSDVGRAVEGTNRAVYYTSPDHFHATLFYARVDPAAGRLHYASAGHEPALLVRKGATRVHRLESTGAAIGVSDRSPYGRGSFSLEAGDILLAFTDGITKTLNPSGRAFSLQGVLEIVERYSSAPAAELAGHLMAAAGRFAAPAQPACDRTIAAVRFNGQAQHRDPEKEEVELALAAA